MVNSPPSGASASAAATRPLEGGRIEPVHVAGIHDHLQIALVFDQVDAHILQGCAFGGAQVSVRCHSHRAHGSADG
jgi:hypothetical protein